MFPVPSPLTCHQWVDWKVLSFLLLKLVESLVEMKVKLDSSHVGGDVYLLCDL